MNFIKEEKKNLKTNSFDPLIYEVQKATHKKRKHKVKILLVDDHQTFRKIIRNIVTIQDDLQVIAEASDGEEAIKKAVEESPDVIIMDVDMPHMNGIEATQKLMSIMPKVKVIGLSSHNNEEVLNNMQSAGATAYITKSKAFESLCITIRRVVDV